MRIMFSTLILLLVWSSTAAAECTKAEICGMLKTMGHFDILNQCPNAAPILSECKKVSHKPLEDLPKPHFVDNENGTITDTVNKLIWLKKGLLKKNSLVTAKEYAATYNHEELGGGWRVPTLPELKSLMTTARIKNVSGKKAWINPIFDDGRGHYYWSSTTCEEVSEVTDRYQKKLCQQGDQGAWLVHFNIGALFWHHVDTENYFVWLVKDAP